MRREGAAVRLQYQRAGSAFPTAPCCWGIGPVPPAPTEGDVLPAHRTELQPPRDAQGIFSLFTAEFIQAYKFLIYRKQLQGLKQC